MTPESDASLELLIRAIAFRLLIEHGEPVVLNTLAEATGIHRESLRTRLAWLSSKGKIRLRNSQVIGSAGLSVVPDRHEIELEDRRFWTWCAYDILGIFGALRATGRAFSPSPSDGKTIELRFRRGRPLETNVVLFRPDSDLLQECHNVYEQWCPNSNLFSSPQLAERWANERGLKGRILSLGEAADLAADDWNYIVATSKQQSVNNRAAAPLEGGPA